ncbi:tyrosine-type recombinase/integrase [Candidatus Bipolaricaulota bacterium]|nr:tyrosine-type recombinase/integrase [Candidatus Bipolaricaulota bacterium]
MNKNELEITLSTLIQHFFCRRLITQRNASPQTIASYRDTFRLLFHYAQKKMKKAPAALQFEDLDADFVLRFLDYLEQERGNCERTRNIRLAAIRSFLRYVSYRLPGSLSTIQEVLAIPLKRFDRPSLEFLQREEVEAIITAPDKTTFSGHRDFVMFMTLYNTGARVSEIIRLRVSDVCLESKASILIHGKGRKQRAVPLWKSTQRHLKMWLLRLKSDSHEPFFPSRCGRPLSRSGVEYRLRLAVNKAAERFPSLEKRKVSPHTFRHTTAMHLLQSGVDITVIALWLGHESPITTHLYVEADLSMKEKALRKLQDPSLKSLRYQASDSILSFLESL